MYIYTSKLKFKIIEKPQCLELEERSEESSQAPVGAANTSGR